MQTLNFGAYSPTYPMLLQRIGDNIIDFVHIEKVHEGQTMESNIFSYLRDHVITKIVESRKPKGKQSEPNAMWYRVEFL